jgi:hypothetical protein
MLGKSRGSKRKSVVPNLSSRTRSQAQSDLTARGFSYTESTETTGNSSLNLNVISQSVTSGETILYGSSISFVYYNYVDPTVYTYGPCQAYDSNVSYSCVGGGQNQATTTTYRRRQLLADGVGTGSYEECSSTSSTTGSQYTDGVCGYTAPTITYGSCVAYGSPIANLGSGNQCSGSFYQTYTDYRYSTRRQIFVNGSWDGSSYDTSGCGTADSRSITGSSQIDGLCGYAAPCSITSYSGWSYSNITWSGSCPSGTESGTATSRSRTDNCNNTYNESGSYSVSRSCTPPAVVWYCTSNYVNEVGGQFTWDSNITGSACDNYAFACSTSGYPATPSIPNCCSGLNGNPCGYNNTGTYNCAGTCVGASSPPETCVCNYSDLGSYHYSPQCCPGGSQRTGSLSGQTVNSCCPNVSKTQKFECKSYDVTNSASVNYFQCYSVGECAANSNPDGSRTVCYV